MDEETHQTPATTPGHDHGLSHVVHVVGALIGVGGLAFSMTVVHLPTTHRDDLAPWWVASAVVLVGGLAVLAALGSLARVPAAVVRATAGAWALLFLAVVVSVPALIAGGGGESDNHQSEWLSGFVGAALAGAALAWRLRASIAYLAVACTLLGVARWSDSDRTQPIVAVQDAVYTATSGLILMSVVWMVLRAAQTVDAAAATDAAQAVAEARAVSRAAEQDRLAAVVHDGVLAALLAGASGTVPSDAVALEARRALDDLDELHQPLAETGGITEKDLVLRLRSAVVGAGAELEADVRPARIPEEAATKLAAAAAEALRNSVRHAGAGARRTVAVTVRPKWAEVRVHDDGTGFDPDAVPAGRLGVRGSILGRMSRLQGGYAEVRSRPGVGTEIVVGWRS